MTTTKISLRREPGAVSTYTPYRPSDTTTIQNAVIMDDQYDVALYMASVHGPLHGITSDYILADPTPGQRQYITEMHKIALLFYAHLPARPVGERVRQAIMADANMHAILARNKPTNSLIQWILGVQQHAQEEEQPTETAFRKLVNRVTKKDDKKTKEEEEK